MTAQLYTEKSKNETTTSSIESDVETLWEMENFDETEVRPRNTTYAHKLIDNLRKVRRINPQLYHESHNSHDISKRDIYDNYTTYDQEKSKKVNKEEHNASKVIEKVSRDYWLNDTDINDIEFDSSDDEN